MSYKSVNSKLNKIENLENYKNKRRQRRRNKMAYEARRMNRPKVHEPKPYKEEKWVYSEDDE